MTSHLRVVRWIARELGPLGILVIGWTVVMACAMLKGDRGALDLTWDDLKWTWRWLVLLWVGFKGVGGLVVAIKKGHPSPLPGGPVVFKPSESPAAKG